ncbi:MAG: CpsD/CapB family tyrosine-protein kinase [Polyangiaceae bacterium]
MSFESPNRTIVVQRRDMAAGAGESPVRVVPAWASPPDTHVLVMLGDPQTDQTAALRVIRHRLEQKRAEGMWTFGVVSARDGEGKSTFASQLALVLSESQRARVLMIESNFTRPGLARILGFKVPEGNGFSAQIVRKMRGSLEPWCVVALGPSLHVLAESTTEPSFPETLHSTHFQNAIGFLSRGYDFLVVDGPTILGAGDANVVENSVDGVIVVARSKVTRGTDLRDAMRQLGERRTIGVVLWDAPKKEGKGR